MKIKNQDEALLWGDIETFGLNPVRDPIIELGFILTNLDLEIIAEPFVETIWGPIHERRWTTMQNDPDDAFVYKMHTENGLFKEARASSMESNRVQDEAIHWLRKHGAEGMPLAGSSDHFDQRSIRHQMPKLMDSIHYRIIDNSVLKELCRRYNPRVFAGAPEARHVAPDHHRVDLCLEDTIEEFRFYRDNFFFDARNDVFYAG